VLRTLAGVDRPSALRAHGQWCDWEGSAPAVRSEQRG
jgi:hypothetical protein